MNTRTVRARLRCSTEVRVPEFRREVEDTCLGRPCLDWLGKHEGTDFCVKSKDKDNLVMFAFVISLPQDARQPPMDKIVSGSPGA